MKNYKQNLRCSQELKDKIKETESKLQLAWNEMLDLIKDENIKTLITNHCYIAGGAIYSTYNNKIVNDYDVWCDDKEIVNQIEKYLEDNKLIKWNTNNAVSIYSKDTKNIFQFIKKWTGEPLEIIRDFDFKHNQFAFIQGNVIPFTSIRYLYAEKLCINFNRARDLSNVLLRIPKMIKKGFEIYKSDHLKLLKIVLNNAIQELKDIKESELHY